MAAGYVTNYGNVENDGLSWATSLRSIQSAIDKGLFPIYITGYFNETIIRGDIIGDGYAVWDGTLLSKPQTNPSATTRRIENLILQNFDSIQPGYYPVYKNVICRNIPFIKNTIDQYRYNGWVNSLIINATSSFNPDVLMTNNTVYNCKILLTQAVATQISNSNIISESSVDMKALVTTSFTLFHNTSFKFSGGGLGYDETVFATPTGANDTEKLDNIRQRMAQVYGGVASQYLLGCRYQTDGDLFINPSKENFYLVPGCLATRISYEAGFVGKYPESSLADFATNFISYSNIDAAGNIIDQTVDASAETNIIDLGKLRHINSFEALGERATRNGNQVNIDADLGAVINPGTDLTDGKTYIVRTEAISQTASGKTRDVGETFIATVADGLSFTSDTGYVQEVFLDKPRSFELKASKTDSSLSVAPWIKMDLYDEPRVNYDENGQILYGNADAGYDEATSERLFIRYWKARVTIKAKNLPS